MSSVCLLSVEKPSSKSKFNQRGEKMQKQRKTVKEEQVRGSLVITHCQGPLVPSQGL